MEIKKSGDPLRRCMEKYDTLRDLTLLVADGFSNSLLVYGPGGLGKTYTVTRVLTQHNKEFHILRGYAAPSSFYNFLYDHSQDLIVVDDCDAVFKDASGLNILKAVLETEMHRTVAWETPSSVISVSSFEFTGQVIFLTNYNLKKLSGHMQALLTRVHSFQMDLELDEILARIRYLAIHSNYKGVSKPDRCKVYRFLRDNHGQIPDFNLRHYIKALDMLRYSRTGWRKLLRNSIRNA